MPNWPEVLEQHGPTVWKSVYRLVGNEADAADCFQETFVRALQVSRRAEIHHWAGLLQRIAVQAALDRLRHRIRARHRHSGDTNWDTIGGSEPDPVQNAEAAELATRLQRALADLPEPQATVFALRHLHEMSYETIAEVTDSDTGTVGVLLHRAKKRLAEMLNVKPTCERGCNHAHRD